MTFRERDEKYLTLQDCQKMPNTWWQGGYRTGGRDAYPRRAGQQVPARRRTGSPHRGCIAARPRHGAGAAAGVCCPRQRWGPGRHAACWDTGGRPAAVKDGRRSREAEGGEGAPPGNWGGYLCRVAARGTEAHQYLVIWTDRGGQERKGDR